MTSYLTPRQVSEQYPHLGRPRTIQKWVAMEWVECFRTPGGHIRFSPDQVEKLLQFVPAREHHPEVHAPNPAFTGPRLELVRATRRRRGAA